MGIAHFFFLIVLDVAGDPTFINSNVLNIILSNVVVGFPRRLIPLCLRHETRTKRKEENKMK